MIAQLIPPRPYQTEAVERVRQSIRHGSRRILVVLATGSGKTVVASHIVANTRAKGKRVLFLAHRRELIRQTFAKLVRNGIPYTDVGVIMAGVDAGPVDVGSPAELPSRDDDLWTKLARRRPTASVQVASIDTLRNRIRPEADLVIVDEAHRALAKGYTDIRDAYPKAIHLGLTATPYRADGRGLGESYEDLVAVASPSLLIREGFLVAPRVFTVPASSLPDLGGVRVRGGDYDAEALAKAVDKGGLVGGIVEHWLRHTPGVRTVAFAASVEHSKHIAARFVEAGIAAEHLDGETPAADRDAILRRLERGETLIVSNCGVLCEGWDQPSVKCCILARPTKSTGLYLQQAGRILRPFQGQSAVILDHAGCAVEHGLPQDDREFTLEAKKKTSKAAGEAPVKTCEECFAVLPASVAVCPECGFVFPVKPEVLEENDGQLVEVKPATMDEKRAAWDALCGARGHRKPGWVFYRYRERFGVSTPSGWKVPPNAADAPPSADEGTFGEHSEATTVAYLAEQLRLATEKGWKPKAAEMRFKAKFGRYPDSLTLQKARRALEVPVPAPETAPAPVHGDVAAAVERVVERARQAAADVELEDWGDLTEAAS